MANASNQNVGGRFLIQDSNHLTETPDLGGRFAIQDHDHLSGVTQANAGDDQSQGADREQGDQGKKSKRTGRQFL